MSEAVAFRHADSENSENFHRSDCHNVARLVVDNVGNPHTYDHQKNAHKHKSGDDEDALWTFSVGAGVHPYSRGSRPSPYPSYASPPLSTPSLSPPLPPPSQRSYLSFSSAMTSPTTVTHHQKGCHSCHKYSKTTSCRSSSNKNNNQRTRSRTATGATVSTAASTTWSSADFLLLEKLGSGHFGKVYRAAYSKNPKEEEENDGIRSRTTTCNGNGNVKATDSSHRSSPQPQTKMLPGLASGQKVAIKVFSKSRLLSKRKKNEIKPRRDGRYTAITTETTTTTHAYELLQREINIHSQ